MSANTMICDRCGSAAPAGASTCPNCGAPLGAAAYETRKVDAGWSMPETPAPVEPEPPGYEPTVKVPEPQAGQSVPPVYTPPTFTPSPVPEAPKRSRVWQIVAGCVALLVICCCLVVVASVIIAWQTGAI